MRWWDFTWNKAIAPRNDLFWEAVWNEVSNEFERWWCTHDFECRCKGKSQKGNCPLSECKMKFVWEKKSQAKQKNYLQASSTRIEGKHNHRNQIH